MAHPKANQPNDRSGVPYQTGNKGPAVCSYCGEELHIDYEPGERFFCCPEHSTLWQRWISSAGKDERVRPPVFELDIELRKKANLEPWRNR